MNRHELYQRNNVGSTARASTSGCPYHWRGAGTGISAKFEEAGGIDLIIIYNSGRFRMAGRGSLAGLMPFGDANQIVMEMAGEVLTVVRDTPVLAGVCASDPFRQMDKFLDQVKAEGFAGIQNFPTVGLIDGSFRANLEETGMGYDREVELVKLAREKDLLTTPYAFTPEEAERMTEVGADVIVAHMGLTTKDRSEQKQRCRLSKVFNVFRLLQMLPSSSGRRHCFMSRWPDCNARRRSIRTVPYHQCPWILRSEFYGTLASGNGSD